VGGGISGEGSDEKPHQWTTRQLSCFSTCHLRPHRHAGEALCRKAANCDFTNSVQFDSRAWIAETKSTTPGQIGFSRKTRKTKLRITNSPDGTSPTGSNDVGIGDHFRHGVPFRATTIDTNSWPPSPSLRQTSGFCTRRVCRFGLRAPSKPLGCKLSRFVIEGVFIASVEKRIAERYCV